MQIFSLIIWFAKFTNPIHDVTNIRIAGSGGRIRKVCGAVKKTKNFEEIRIFFCKYFNKDNSFWISLFSPNWKVLKMSCFRTFSLAETFSPLQDSLFGGRKWDFDYAIPDLLPYQLFFFQMVMNIILFCRIIMVDFSDVLWLGGSRSREDQQHPEKPTTNNGTNSNNQTTNGIAKPSADERKKLE